MGRFQQSGTKRIRTDFTRLFIISNRCHVSNVLSDQGIRYLSEDRCAISKVQSELDIPQLLMYWQTKKGYGGR